MIEVPDLVGLTKSEIQQMMVNLKIDVSGEGDKVVKQAPSAGVKVKEGSTIRLYMTED
jgi:stage V sporulation protein D (sporulation-specific penicillin-binding protein)